MMSLRKSLAFFLLFVIIGSYIAYKITGTAYDGAYNYDKDYGYAIGNTDVYTPDPQQ